MEKYKLLKSLPGIQQGVIFVNHKTACNRWFPESEFENGELIQNIAIHGFLSADVLNPEWFERVKDKTLEIMSFKCVGVDTEWKRCQDNLFRTTCGSNQKYSEETHLKDGDKIYSVKRLSDGEVFTIGDEVYFFKENKWKVDNFLIRQDGSMLVRSKDCLNVEILDETLHKVNPPKEKFVHPEGEGFYEKFWKDFKSCHPKAFVPNWLSPEDTYKMKVDSLEKTIDELRVDNKRLQRDVMSIWETDAKHVIEIVKLQNKLAGLKTLLD